MKMRFIAVAAFLLFLLAACGGGSGDGNPGANLPPIENNTPNPSEEPDPTSPEEPESFFTLSVAKFGQGLIVSSNVTGIDCNEDCTASYPEGTKVTLAASGSGEYDFRSWTGCDAVVDHNCTVILDADKTVFPTFGKSPVVALDVRVLDEFAMQNLVKQEGIIYYFNQIPQVAALQEGNLMVSGVGEGLLRRITTITEVDGLIAVSTADATLEDIIAEGTISLYAALTPEDLAPSSDSTDAQLKSLALPTQKFNVTINQIVYDEDNNPETTDDQVRLVGSITGSFALDFALDKPTFLGPISECKILFLAQLDQNLELQTTGAIPFFVREIPLKKYTFTPIPVPAMPMVVIVPEITIYAKVSGDAEITVTAGVSLVSSYTAGAWYKQGEGWRPVGVNYQKFGYQAPTATAEAALKAALGPELATKFNAFAGPTVSVEGYGRLKAGLSTANEAWWKIYGGVAGSAGGKVQILKWTLASFSYELFKMERELASWSGGSSTNPLPGTPTGLSAQPVSFSRIDLTWQELPESWTVSGYKIYRNGSYIGSTTTTFFSDLNLSQSTNYCYTVSAYHDNAGDSPQSATVCSTTLGPDQGILPIPTGLQATTKSTSLIDLSWTSLGETVAGYTVYRNDIPIRSTAMSSHSDEGLGADKLYCYQVLSFDSQGNVSDLSDQACAWTIDTGTTSYALPDTGQTTCYDSSGFLIACAGTGQDGEFNFNPMSFTDMGNGTVRDNVTGLIWQKTDDGTARPLQDALDYCNELDLGDGIGWRMPTRRDLMHIVDYGLSSAPALNDVFDINYYSYFVFSSSTYHLNNDFTWFVDFNRGDVSTIMKQDFNYVRCVKGDFLPTASYNDNGDGTVTDHTTGLVWQQTPDGEPYVFQSALNYCNNLTLGGSSNWRLPNIKELESIVDETSSYPAMHSAFSTEVSVSQLVQNSSYWSSTSLVRNPLDAWIVDFDNGRVNLNYKIHYSYVRCVR